MKASSYKGRYIKFNGIKKSDSEMARIMCKSIKFWPNDAVKKTEKMIQWLISNCSNVNEMNAECILDEAWYNIIGIYNNNICRDIYAQVEAKVEQNRILAW